MSFKRWITEIVCAVGFETNRTYLKHTDRLDLVINFTARSALNALETIILIKMGNSRLFTLPSNIILASKR